jgi:type I restriction enzyme S subunit
LGFRQGPEIPRLSDVVDHITKDAAETYSRIAPEGAVLVLVRGMGLAKSFPISLIERPMAFNQDLKALIPNSNIAGAFLLYALRFAGPRVLQNVSNAAHGTKRLSQDDLNNVVILVPPLNEQRSIAVVLDAMRTALELTKRTEEKSTELKRAAMRELFTRGLHGEAQKETEIGPLPESWRPTPVGKLGAVKGGKRMPKGISLVQEDTGRPYIRVIDFTDQGVRSDGILFVPKGYEEVIQRYRISSRDVYISIAGSIGLVGQVLKHLDDANLTENAARIVFDHPDIVPRYVMYTLAGEVCQDQITRATAKNAQPKLALTRIEQILVPLPCTANEQRQIVAVLDAIDRKIDLHKRKKGMLEDLFRTLLNKLMTGEIRVADLDLSTFGNEVAAAEAAA